MTPRDTMITLLVSRICTEVSELPDRTSPDDAPEMMLVTAQELSDIVRAQITESPLVIDTGWSQ